MKSQPGQILLIAVMLMATVITVVMSTVFKTNTDTKLTKLEEESQKALSAAQSAFEASLKEGNISNISTQLSGLSKFTGSATFNSDTGIEFTTRAPIKTNEQYTFYLSNVAGAPEDPNFNNLTSAYSGDLNICFGTTSFNPALEITIVKSDYSIEKITINPSVSNIINPSSDPPTKTAGSGATGCPTGETFTQRQTIDMDSGALFMIVRVIANSSGLTKIGFKGISNLPLQERLVTAKASTTGADKVTKIIEGSQSYPQIPAEFFVTSF